MKSQGSATAEAIQSVYNAAAAKYDQTRLRTPFQRRFDKSERMIIRRHLGVQQHVLEVGAGTGRLTNELLSLAKHVTVVDNSAEMLAQLKQKYSQQANLVIQLRNVFELQSLPGYGSFSAVVSMRMLPHIEDIAGVVRIMRDAIEPKGKMIFDFWNPCSYVYWRKRGASVYNHFVDYATARSLITAAGLKLIAIEGAGFDSPFNVDLELFGRTPLKRIAYSLVAVCMKP